MKRMMGSCGFLSASLVATALGGALLGCGGGTAQPTNASPSCYPSCIKTLLEQCPLQGTCEGTVGSELTTVCYANGIKIHDTLMASGSENVTVNNASGQPCYTVAENSAPGATSRGFTVTANGQTVATIADNQATENSAIIYCSGTPTVLMFPTQAAACWPLWWNDEQRCTFGTCTFP